MIPTSLLIIGWVFGILTLISSLRGEGQDKLVPSIFPFLCVLAAAVAKYIGF